MKLAAGLLILLCGIGLRSSAQQPAPAASQTPTVTAADSTLHENVVKLVELMGSRKRILDGRDKALAEGREKMLQIEPNLTPEFGDEWVKRMHDRYNVDDYLNVIIAVYEKHFNKTEIEELTQIQLDANDSKTPTVSPALKEKLGKEGSTIMSEVLGGCGQVGAKLGADIGQEIGREHPEWVKEVKPAGDAAPKK
jgi:hypothetical protein